MRPSLLPVSMSSSRASAPLPRRWVQVVDGDGIGELGRVDLAIEVLSSRADRESRRSPLIGVRNVMDLPHVQGPRRSAVRGASDRG